MDSITSQSVPAFHHDPGITEIVEWPYVFLKGLVPLDSSRVGIPSLMMHSTLWTFGLRWIQREKPSCGAVDAEEDGKIPEEKDRKHHQYAPERRRIKTISTRDHME